MCQTYRGGIEGWLESVSGPYGSLIEGSGQKKNKNKEKLMSKSTPGEPIWDFDK